MELWIPQISGRYYEVFSLKTGLKQRPQLRGHFRISISIVKNPTRASGSIRLTLPTLVLCQHPTIEVWLDRPGG
jgi:hypothetical protein